MTAADPVGCRGRCVDPHPRCLAHLGPVDQASYYAGLGPGARVDHRGTTFPDALFGELRGAVGTPIVNGSGGEPCFGDAFFDEAHFDDCHFGGARFTGFTHFSGATLTTPHFGGAVFSGFALFHEATLIDPHFGGATFADHTDFVLARFPRGGFFGGATFAGFVSFVGAVFGEDAFFGGASFGGTPELGPLLCVGDLDLSGAVFTTPVTIEAAAERVTCRRTRWEQTATLRLRYAELDLTGAVVVQPLAVATQPAPFTLPGFYPTTVMPEGGLSGDDTVRVASISGVDAMHVVLTDTDLTRCRFTGTFHLDQLRMEGRTDFAGPPRGVHRRRPMWWTRRRTLAEEHAWRALGQPPPDPAASADRAWTPGPDHPDPRLTPGPDDLAPVYRALRKASEDAKNEPDAADFYMGEMEMRRHDRARPPGERALLTGYWLLSGYGLRALRALGWLVATMAATVVLLAGWGLPTGSTKPLTTGVQAAPGQPVRLTADTPEPTVSGPLGDRLTWPRAGKAAEVAVNSVFFRASGQNLTPVGTGVEMASRFLEPVLLALAVLAVRGRVKR